MKRVLYVFLVVVLIGSACTSNVKKEESASKELPNIVIIYMDDLGYGDVKCYGATEIETPNIDKLAEGGVRFTDGHSASATCSPSRYSLLTGMYPWRNKNARILPGTAPLIINTEQMTIPKMLEEKGFYTGVVGKWHMGLGDGYVDWNEHISPGPNEVGFNYSYIMAATQDRVPTVYIEDGDVVGLDPDDPIMIDYGKNFEGEPTALDHPEMLTMKWHHGHNNSIVNGIPRIGFMKGGTNAKWSDVDMADHFLVKAQSFIKEHKADKFFLYYALQQPHVPRTPHPRFVGSSGMGPRGDVIVEADWCVGEFIKTLEEEGILDNTLIIFTSDNGPVLNDGYYDDAVEKAGDHKPAGDLRGGKYSLFEAGTRVPFIVYWKGEIANGVSNALISQMDIMNSLAKLVESEKLGPDSQEMLDVLLGKSSKGREDLVLEATSRTAYRNGDWVMIPPYDAPPVAKQVNIELGNSTEYKLYNISEGINQQENLAETEREKLEEMIKAYELIRGDNSKVNPLELH
jgi:arylsulfatase A-like enzyme